MITFDKQPLAGGVMQLSLQSKNSIYHLFKQREIACIYVPHLFQPIAVP